MNKPVLNKCFHGITECRKVSLIALSDMLLCQGRMWFPWFPACCVFLQTDGRLTFCLLSGRTLIKEEKMGSGNSFGITNLSLIRFDKRRSAATPANSCSLIPGNSRCSLISYSVLDRPHSELACLIGDDLYRTSERPYGGKGGSRQVSRDRVKEKQKSDVGR